MIWNKSSYLPCQYERFLNGELNNFDVLNVSYELFKTFGFFDDTDQRTCRPGSEPEGNYEYAKRKDNANIIQASFYSGYMKAHELKYQTILLPNGMWDSVYGSSIRHNDKGILNMSGLIEYLMTILPPIEGTRLPELYGDRTFVPILFFSDQPGIQMKTKKF